MITTLDTLPKDGTPQKFAIIAGRVDAWNKLPNAPIGAIYLRRVGEKGVEAINVVCPHAGCFVDFRGRIDGIFKNLRQAANNGNLEANSDQTNDEELNAKRKGGSLIRSG